MPFNRHHVRAFLAQTEIDLFVSSLGAELKALSAAQVQRLIDRTRKLRDKNRDLLQRQRLASRARTGSKGGVSGQANERTAKKVKAFGETLARFEARAKQLNAAAKKAASKGVASKKAAPKKAAPKKPRVPAAVMLRRALKSKRGAEALAQNARPRRSAKAPAQQAAAPIGGVGIASPNLRGVAVASRLDQSGLARIQGHSGTQVRKAQGKRDQRG